MPVFKEVAVYEGLFAREAVHGVVVHGEQPDVPGAPGLRRPAGYRGHFYIRGGYHRHDFRNGNEHFLHDALYQLVQMEMQRRKNTGRSHNCCSPFSAKLKCGDCGEYFGSKVWHSNSKYKRTVWQCNAKFKGESKCATPHLYEQRIKELFLEAVGILMEKREEIIGDCRAVMEALADCGSIDTEMEAVSSEMEVTAGLIQKLVDENATRKLDQHDYRKKYDGYASRYAALESRMDSLKKERERKGIQYDIFNGFLAGLSETVELPVDFNEKLFHRLVDYATVYPDGRMVFTFRNGVEVSTEI